MPVWLYLPFSTGYCKNLLKYIVNKLNQTTYYILTSSISQIQCFVDLEQCSQNYASQGGKQFQQTSINLSIQYLELNVMFGMQQIKAYIDQIASLTKEIREIYFEQGYNESEFQKQMLASIAYTFKFHPTRENMMKYFTEQLGKSDNDKKLLFLSILERLIADREILLRNQEFLEGIDQPFQPKPELQQPKIEAQIPQPKLQDDRDSPASWDKPIQSEEREESLDFQLHEWGHRGIAIGRPLQFIGSHRRSTRRPQQPQRNTRQSSRSSRSSRSPSFVDEYYPNIFSHHERPTRRR